MGLKMKLIQIRNEPKEWYDDDNDKFRDIVEENSIVLEFQDEDEIIKAKERSADSADEISKDVKEVIEEGKEKLDQKQIENLKDVLDETESLREEK